MGLFASPRPSLPLDIIAALLIHPALTGGNEYSRGGLAISVDGSSSSSGLAFQIDQDQRLYPVAPAAMVISFFAPRIALRLGIVRFYTSEFMRWNPGSDFCKSV